MRHAIDLCPLRTVDTQVQGRPVVSRLTSRERNKRPLVRDENRLAVPVQVTHAEVAPKNEGGDASNRTADHRMSDTRI